MIYLSKYSPELNTGDMQKMLYSRFMTSDLVNDLPAFGYIAFTEDHRPIAAGFIRKIEGPYAMLDSYLTNAEFDKELRNEALNLITTALIDVAKTLQVTKLLAFSADQNTIIRAEKHGFISFDDHKFQILSLSNDLHQD